MTETSENVPKPEPSADFSAHRQLVFWLFAATSVIVGLTALLLITADHSANSRDKVTIGPLIAISGTLGAFVSALRRIYLFENIFPTDQYRNIPRGVNGYLIAYSSIPPLVGAIAAMIIFVVFQSGIIKGDIFPVFECETGANTCKDFVDYLKHWKPAQAQDYAKSIVWAFIAGFSERFVPDILNKISNSADPKKEA